MNDDLHYFEKLRTTKVEAIQIKLTYVGEQDKPTPSVIVLHRGREADLIPFQPFKRDELYYGNDTLVKVQPAELESEELQRVVGAAVAVCREQTAPARPAFVSVMFVDTSQVAAGCESVLDRAHTGTLLEAMLEHLNNTNASARETLTQFRERIP